MIYCVISLEGLKVEGQLHSNLRVSNVLSLNHLILDFLSRPEFGTKVDDITGLFMS
jgi:hypothetical protein